MRQITLRLSLTTSLLLLVVSLSGAILLVTVLASRRIADDLSQRYLAETERYVEERMRGFFAPVSDAVTYARAWSRKGVVDPRDLNASVDAYLPFLVAHPQVSSIATGDEGGYSWRLGAEGSEFLERVVTAGDPQAPARFRLLDARGVVVRAYEEKNKFDPRTRPWYADAKREWERAGSASEARLVWSPPFLLNTSKLPGIAAAVPFEDSSGGAYMVTFNVMLEKLSAFTAELRPTAHGSAMVLTQAAEVVGFPAIEEYGSSEARIALVQRINAGGKEENLPRLAHLGSELWPEVERAFLSAVAGGTRRALSLDVGGRTWRLAFQPFELGPGVRLWTGVMVPEDDFLAEVQAQQRQILWVSGLALLAAAGLAMLLARSYARPLRHLAQESDRVTGLDLTPGAPVSTHVLEVQHLAEAQERMRGALDSFARYVPTPVVRELLKQGQAARLGGAVRPLTVMFSDIRNFTTISEASSPEDLTKHLSQYFERLMDIVAEHGGSVDKMIGDAVMSLWGAPVPHADHAARAVRAALACRDWLETFNVRCAAAGRPALHTGFGLSSGEAFVGNVGSPTRLNYTALGDVVNLASRLEGVTKSYGVPILCSEAVRNAAGDEFLWRPLDVLAVKGKHQAVCVFEPVGRVGDVDDATRQWTEEWTLTFQAYRARHFEFALAQLAMLNGARPRDPAVARLTELCRRHVAQPPGDTWDGVTRLDAK